MVDDDTVKVVPARGGAGKGIWTKGDTSYTHVKTAGVIVKRTTLPSGAVKKTVYTSSRYDTRAMGKQLQKKGSSFVREVSKGKIVYHVPKVEPREVTVRGVPGKVAPTAPSPAQVTTIQKTKVPAAAGETVAEVAGSGALGVGTGAVLARTGAAGYFAPITGGYAGGLVGQKIGEAIPESVIEPITPVLRSAFIDEGAVLRPVGELAKGTASFFESEWVGISAKPLSTAAFVAGAGVGGRLVSPRGVSVPKAPGVKPVRGKGVIEEVKFVEDVKYGEVAPGIRAAFSKTVPIIKLKGDVIPKLPGVPKDVSLPVAFRLKAPSPRGLGFTTRAITVERPFPSVDFPKRLAVSKLATVPRVVDLRTDTLGTLGFLGVSSTFPTVELPSRSLVSPISTQLLKPGGRVKLRSREVVTLPVFKLPSRSLVSPISAQLLKPKRRVRAVVGAPSKFKPVEKVRVREVSVIAPVSPTKVPKRLVVGPSPRPGVPSRFPGFKLPSLPSRKVVFKSRKFKSRSFSRYAPSLLGKYSPKRISKVPSVLTGLGVRPIFEKKGKKRVKKGRRKREVF